MPKGQWNNENIPNLAGNYNRYETIITTQSPFVDGDNLYKRAINNSYEINTLFDTLYEISSGDLIISDYDYAELDKYIFGGGN